MIRRALRVGIQGDYLLADAWFGIARPLFDSVKKRH